MVLLKKLDCIEEYCLYLFAFFCPFMQKLSSAFFIVFGSVFLLRRVYEFAAEKKSFTLCKEKRCMSNLLLLIFMLWGFATIIYADDREMLMKRILEQRLCLLLVPAISLSGGVKCDFKSLLRAFVLGNAVFLIYSLGFIAYRYYVVHDVLLYRSFFDSTTLILNMLMHRTYYGLNILVSVVCVFYLLFSENREKKDVFIAKLFLPLALCFFVIDNSRGESLALFSALIYMMTKIAMKSKKNAVILASVCVLSVAAIVAVLPENRSVSSVKAVLNEKKHNDVTDNPRLQIWECATQLLKEKPMCGYAVNNFSDELVESYKKKNFHNGYIYDYNTHNQYLGIGLEYGVFGLAFFFLVMLSVPCFCEKKERAFYIPIAIALVVSCFFESLIDRYNGCATFAFVFVSLGCQRIRRENSILKKQSLLLLSGLSLLAITVYFYSYFSDRNRNDVHVIEKKSITLDEAGEKVFEFVPSYNLSVYHGGYFHYYTFVAFSKCDEACKRRLVADCRVTDDFNGELVRIDGEVYKGGTYVTSCYDLSKPNTWQTLSIDLKNDVKTCIILAFSSTNTGLSFIKGHVQLKNLRFLDEDTDAIE